MAKPNVIPCCIPTKLSCPGLTISSSRDPSSARQAVTVSGHLVAATGSVGAAVILWEELPGQKSFHRVAQAQTDSTGAYTFIRPAGSVKTNRSWYVTATGAQSATLAQMVRAVVSITVSAHKTGTGASVTFSGRVTPSHSGEKVRLQERTVSGWKAIATVRLTGKSTFSFHRSFSGSASALVRAGLGADSRNIASYSATKHTTL